MTNESKEVTLVANVNPVQIFADPKLADDVIEKMRKDLLSVDRDISTQEGRDTIASLAYKVARSKTALDKMGADLKAEYMAKVKPIDAERSRLWDKMEALQKEIRKPLTDWEEADEKRKLAHETAISNLSALAVFMTSDPIPTPRHPNNVAPEEIQARLDALPAAYDRSWEEFSARALQVRDRTLAALTEHHKAAVQHAKDQADLARLREEQAKRDQEERDRKIAEAARIEAEQKAAKAAEEKAAAEKAERDRIEAETQKRLQAEKEEREKAEAATRKAEQEKAEAESKAAAEKQAAADAAKAAEEKRLKDLAEAEERRQADLKAAEEKRVREQAEADQRAKEAADKAEADKKAAAARAEADKQAAIKAEQDRVAAAKAAEDAATAKREADKKHAAKINGEIATALNNAIGAFNTQPEGDPKNETSLGKWLTIAIAQGRIPHVTAKY